MGKTKKGATRGKVVRQVRYQSGHSGRIFFSWSPSRCTSQVDKRTRDSESLSTHDGNVVIATLTEESDVTPTAVSDIGQDFRGRGATRGLTGTTGQTTDETSVKGVSPRRSMDGKDHHQGMTKGNHG